MNITVHNLLLGLHITAGIISLVLFWIPIVTAKGRSIHLKVGKIYVITMGFVVGSAFILSGIRIAQGAYEPGLALLFLSMITLVPLSSGVQVLKAKKPNPRYRRFRLTLGACTLLIGIGLLIGWYQLNSVLLLAFGLLGVLAGGADLRRFRHETGSSKTWLREHYEGMLFSGGAAYTAFFAFGGNTLLSNILTGWWAIVPWVMPTLLTFALLPFVHRHYNQTKTRASNVSHVK